MKSLLKRSLWLLLAGAVLAGGWATADLIVLKDGREYDGTLVRATVGEIVFRRGDKEERYPRADVVHLHLQQQREWDRFTRAAEIPDPDLQEALKQPVDPKALAGAGTVTLYEKDSIRLRTPQTWEQQYRSIVTILKEHGESASICEVAYRKAEEETDILHAVTIRPDGTILQLRDTAVQEEAPWSAVPRYDTMVRRRFALPDGKPGNIMDLAWRRTRVTPVASIVYYDEFLFGGMDPVRDRRVEILVPVGGVLHWQVLNDPEKTVVFTPEKTADGTWFRWQRRNTPQLLPEPLMPPVADLVPRLVVSARPGTWADVAREIRAMIDAADARFAAVPPAPGTGPAELWEQISRNVQDVAVPLLASGSQPLEPGETWTMRRAAALDRTYLFYRWLKAAGTPGVEWAWIRSRSEGALAPDVPALEAFTLPAVCLRSGDQTEFWVLGDDLDQSREPAAAQGEAACLTAAGGPGRLPATEADRWGAEHQIDLEFNRNGRAQVTQRITYRGPEAKAVRSWRRLTEEQIRNVVERQVHSVDARAEQLRFRVLGDVRMNEAEIILVLNYEIPDFADIREQLVSFKAPWLNFDAGVVGRRQRLFPLFWGNPRTDRIHLRVKAPAGYRLEVSPAIDLTGTVSRLKADMNVTAGLYDFRLFYQRQVLAAPASAYAELKQCLEARAQVGRQYWVWRKD